MVNKPKQRREDIEQVSAIGLVTSFVKNTVYAILLTGQVVTTGLSGPAAVSVLTSKGDTIEKTLHGIAFPKKVYDFLNDIPQSTERYNEYDKFLLENDEIGDYLSDLDFLRKEGKTAIIEAQKNLELINTGVENATEYLPGTLMSAILTLLFYLSIAQACKFGRLQDKDALLDKLRKGTWRNVFKSKEKNKDDFEVIRDTLYLELGLSDEEAESLLETLLRRLKRRNQ